MSVYMALKDFMSDFDEGIRLYNEGKVFEINLNKHQRHFGRRYVIDLLERDLNNRDWFYEDLYTRFSAIPNDQKEKIGVDDNVMKTLNKFEQMLWHVNTILEFMNRNLPESKIEEDLPEEFQQRIAWLYSIGVIDYLKQEYGCTSELHIGKILSYGVGIPADTIRNYIRRFEGTNKLDDYSEWIDQRCLKLNITKKK